MTSFQKQKNRRKVMKTVLITITLFALTACGGVQHKKIESANGNYLYTMDCSGFSHTIDICMQKAEELCEAGFSIVQNKSYTIEHPVSPDGYYKHPTKIIAIECHTNNAEI
jgi:hypothetical protein